jgi:hypothetical protein
MASETFAKITVRNEKRQYWANKDAQELVLSLRGRELYRTSTYLDLEPIIGYHLNSGIYSLTGDQKGTLKVSKIKSL